MPNVLKISLLFILLFQNESFSQTNKNIAHRGGYVKFGSFKTGESGLSNLNTTLEAAQLDNFNNSMFFVDYGYSLVSKKGIYLSFGTQLSTQRTDTKLYNQSLLVSNLMISGGYEIINKNNFSITPTLGGGIGSATLNVSEIDSPTASNFTGTLFLSKKNNTTIQSFVAINPSLIGTYKVKVGSLTEKIEGGKLRIERQLPISFEVGYLYRKNIGNWLASNELKDGPQTNFSGIFFALRLSSMYKKKYFEAQ
jgi:hypothetical protein